MVSTFSLLLYPLVHIITLEITAVSAYYVYKQRIAAYSYAKGILLLVHILFGGVVLLEFFRTSVLSPELIPFYTYYGTIFVLIDVILLTLLAVTVYTRPTGVGYAGILAELRAKKFHASLFIIYSLYIAFTGAYLVVFSPFEVAQVPSVTGVIVPIGQFSITYLAFLLVVLVVFMIYPSTLLVLASRKVKDHSVRRVLVILPICWSAIGADLLAFNGYLLSFGVDATPFAYLIASLAFGVTALVFRRASLLTGLFEPIKPTGDLTATYPFTSRIGAAKDFLPGRNFLLEVNPSLAFEQVVVDFAVELLSNNYMVYVFTTKGSPIYNSLSRTAGVRFFILSTKVTYAKPDEQPYQILVPSTDQAVLLDLVDKTLAASAEAKVGIVFDSISDMILISGFEDTYKFLKQLNETLNQKNVVSLFLMTLGAHDERTVSLIRSLFANQLVYDLVGLKMTRAP